MKTSFGSPSTLIAALLGLAVGAADLLTAAGPADNPIVPNGAQLELLHTRQVKLNSGLTEGPAAAPDGSIYFTDMPFGRDNGMILRFDPKTRQTTVFTAILTGRWAFLFWYVQHLRNLPDLGAWTESEKSQLVSKAVWLVTLTSIAGNFLAAGLARRLRYRRAIAYLCLGYFLSMLTTYSVPLDHGSLWYGFAAIGLCQGVFALFTMYMPPLFPTLLRTTGAGFCYNIGRIVAGLGTVFFGLFSKVGDYRLALLYAGFLFLPAAGIALKLPETGDEKSTCMPE
jgi:hypothetical protein